MDFLFVPLRKNDTRIAIEGAVSNLKHSMGIYIRYALAIHVILSPQLLSSSQNQRPHTIAIIDEHRGKRENAIYYLLTVYVPILNGAPSRKHGCMFI